ncbi:MAG: class I SAM-dependent methyltransferase [Gammaproteobacteria bacterium]|nr:class I SAM-dependent methyltransferase [Gammaproteobacteria bacterium]
MNTRIFESLMKVPGLKQEPWEWRMFLEICSTYLKNNKIKNPVVVELGVLNNRQKEFYEHLFDAEHIGIDISSDRSIPDILGDTHDIKTLAVLKRKLKERPIDILFIDAGHAYEDIKEDFEMYESLCDGLVVIHDIETYRNTGRKSAQVWKFWDELRGREDYKDFLFISLFKRRGRGNQRGIGIIVKK